MKLFGCWAKTSGLPSSLTSSMVLRMYWVVLPLQNVWSVIVLMLLFWSRRENKHITMSQTKTIENIMTTHLKKLFLTLRWTICSDSGSCGITSSLLFPRYRKASSGSFWTQDIDALFRYTHLPLNWIYLPCCIIAYLESIGPHTLGFEKVEIGIQCC